MDSAQPFELNRREEVLAFCRASGFEVPKAFDRSPQTYRYIVVDTSCAPPLLHKQSGFRDSQVIDFLAAPENAGRTFRVFDFKRYIEVFYPGHVRKLLAGPAFDWQRGAPQHVA
jgi:hypothetical protein